MDNKNDNSQPAQVENVASKDDDKILRMRTRILQELLETEEKYLQDLYTLTVFYINPLKSVERFPEINSAHAKGDVKVLFSTVELIFDGNNELLSEVKAAISAPDFVTSAMIGKIFLNNIDKLCQYYGVFCNHQKEAMDSIDKIQKSSANFKNFIEQCKANPETSGLGLLDFLVKPFQRLLKYPLLLKELIKNTPADHPDYENLQEAVKKLNVEVDSINKNKAKADNLKKMLEINSAVEGYPRGFKLLTPSRKFAYEGTLMKISGNHDQERHFLLFNDCLMYCKKKGGGKYIFRGLIYLNKLQVEDIKDTTSFKVFRTDKNLTYILYGQEKKEKDTWLHEIKVQQEKLNQYSTGKSTLRSSNATTSPTQVIRFYVTGEKTFKSFAVTPETTVEQLCNEAVAKKIKASPDMANINFEYTVSIVVKSQEQRTLSGEEKMLEVYQSQLKKDSKFGNEQSHFSLNFVKRDGPVIQRTISERGMTMQKPPPPPTRPPPSRAQSEMWNIRHATVSGTPPPPPTSVTPSMRTDA
mmetsp:Transcript_18534/g.25989  ORF Transcript_18534/g.25989 Transcript_18534/m.25989 type:complete len:527 (+) Transcript_18534:147-1727(+)